MRMATLKAKNGTATSWPQLPRLVNSIKKKQKKAGVTTDTLLKRLNEQRKRLYRERYGARQ